MRGTRGGHGQITAVLLQLQVPHGTVGAETGTRKGAGAGRHPRGLRCYLNIKSTPNTTAGYAPLVLSTKLDKIQRSKKTPQWLLLSRATPLSQTPPHAAAPPQSSSRRRRRRRRNPPALRSHTPPPAPPPPLPLLAPQAP